VAVSFAEGLVGLVLDERYRLDAVLGEGGMGAVFRATHLAMDRKVAVKLLKPHLSNNEASLQRFLREARSTMKVDSPHAVKVLDYGVTPLRDYYMVLEYLDGRTVQRELDIDGAFAPARVVHIARQALDALAAAHATGLVHRDIKPENILLMSVGADPDYTKLLDFGVAKLMEGAAKSSQSNLALTQIGTVFGTPEFMSPEQACGHPLDGRSDLYSLAGTMFAMLTGCGLFEAGSAIEWLTHHVRTPPPHLADVDPKLASYPELDALLARCLAKKRDQRPENADDMAAELAALVPTLSRPPGKAPSASTSKGRVFSTSTFFEGLPLETVDPGATLMPGASLELPPATDEVRAVRSRKSGVWLGIGALVVLGVISVAVGIAMSKTNASTSGSGSRSEIDAAVASAPDAAAHDAVAVAVADATPPDAPADAVVAVKPPRSNALLQQRLREAEAALRDGRAMAQMGAAQLALEQDPRNTRAQYLFGDALIKNGLTERGCAYLRALKHLPLAVSRANAAGCPN
jgi:serine/threonine-protein kinase